jgi:hypothetical protein
MTKDQISAEIKSAEDKLAALRAKMAERDENTFHFVNLRPDGTISFWDTSGGEYVHFYTLRVSAAAPPKNAHLYTGELKKQTLGTAPFDFTSQGDGTCWVILPKSTIRILLKAQGETM